MANAVTPVIDTAATRETIRVVDDQSKTLPELGTVLNERYRLGVKRGEGGMGVVYEGEDLVLHRRVAIKVLSLASSQDPEWTERFQREAQASAQLAHENITALYDFGKLKDGGSFLVMQMLEGETLRAHMDRHGKLSALRAVEIGEQIAAGLSAAHAAGIVHRDVKPENIFLHRKLNGEVSPKLLDFGLAKVKPRKIDEVPDGPAGSASILAGTPEYVAPEQAMGHEPGPSADLYAFGVVLYEMVTGELPFRAPTVHALLRKHVSERAPRASSIESSIPDELDVLIAELLAKEPAGRPHRAEQASMQLGRIRRRLQLEATAVRPNPLKNQPTDKIARKAPEAAPRYRKRTLAAVLLISGALGIAGGAWVIARSEPPAAPVAPPRPVIAAPAEPALAPVAVPALQVPPNDTPPAEVATPTRAQPVAAPGPEDILPLTHKAATKRPKNPVEPTATAVTPCEPSDVWRQGAMKDVRDLQKLAAASVEASKRFEVDEVRVSKAIKEARDPEACGRAMSLIESLRRTYAE